MKLTVHLEGKNKAELAEGLRAHLALFGDETTTTKRTRTKPEPTVSEDEDDDFGTESLSEDDVNEDEEETETDEAEEDEDGSVSFAEVRAVLNKYGEKNAEGARAILVSFGIKSPKDLSNNKKYGKHYAAIYQKVMAKLKAAKKSR